MQPFDLNVLYWPSTVIFFATLAISFHITKSPSLSISVSFVKAGVYAVYFGYFFDSAYTFLDDLTYLEGGLKFLQEGIGLSNLYDNWENVLIIGKGDHFIYYLYNTYAFRLFGDGYYAPVALNVLITLLIGFFGTRLAMLEFEIKSQTAILFYVFLILHPDIMAWSNIINGKDILVLMLHVMLLASLSMYFRRNYWSAFFLAMPVIVILLFLRFYVPLLFAVALVVNTIFHLHWRESLRLIFSSLLLIFAVVWIGDGGLQYVFNSLRENLVNPVYGFLRIIFTPIPFNTDDNYKFLDIPAFIHWLLIPFAAIGIYKLLCIKLPFPHFVVIYFFLFLSLYAVYGELQGPRHRVQLDYAWAVFQFIGLHAFLMKPKKARGLGSKHVFSTC